MSALIITISVVAIMIGFVINSYLLGIIGVQYWGFAVVSMVVQSTSIILVFWTIYNMSLDTNRNCE